ncbi:diguanylate cyclase [Konateibacter massiliensis]|uniref:diguanylate cyclase n=1 Tax=Konateibacter massiliensis TaxID=2002841 RepID=UPI000C14AE52|nr:diguanylate cyclase [Konateibacter massiliensis]
MEEFYKTVKREYEKIDRKWMWLHFKAIVGTVILTFFTEIALGFLMYYTKEISTTMLVFWIKYLIIPSGLNLIMVRIVYKVLTSEKVSQYKKIYTLSLVYVGIAFVVFVAHGIFTSLYFVFFLPILLTVIYANGYLTVNTSIFSLIMFLIAELFIKWDEDKVSILSNGIQLGNFITSLIVLVVVSVICALIVQFEKEKNAASKIKEMERYELEQRLQIDGLTGVYNRVAFKNTIKDMEDDKMKVDNIFAMIDLDNFKLLNDTLGHVMGDYCLIEIGRILKKNCEDAIPFRYGGDEFGVVFRNHTVEGVVEICKQIQKSYEELQFEGRDRVPLTLSIGIAKQTKDIAPSVLIVQTDEALYQSKIVKDKITVYENKE